VHFPAEPVALQASHCAVHAVSQQTPSTQWFDVHSAFPPQLSPSSFKWHAPLIQVPPGAQSVLAAHDVLHASAALSHR